MKPQFLLLTAAMLTSTQAAAWGEFLGNALKGVAEQAAGNAVQQATGQAVPQAPVQQPYMGQGVPAYQPYGAGGCVQNVPAGPPGLVADTDNNGCITHLEYSNYVSYLAKAYPQYLNGGVPAAMNGMNNNTITNAAAAAAAALINQNPPAAGNNSQAVGNAVQGLMGLFGR